MTITYRRNKIFSLTHEELDENFRDLRYDTTLQRVVESGNTTTVAVRVSDITANSVTAESTIIEGIGVLLTDELLFGYVDPTNLNKKIEISANTKLVGPAGSFYSPGSIVQVDQRLYKQSATIPADNFSPLQFEFTPVVNDSNNSIKLDISLFYGLDAFGQNVTIQLYDTDTFLSNLGVVTSTQNAEIQNKLYSFNTTHYDTNVSSNKTYKLKFHTISGNTYLNSTKVETLGSVDYNTSKPQSSITIYEIIQE